MEIQILGLREVWDEKRQKNVKKHWFFQNRWTASSVQEVLEHPEKVLEQVPEAERYNLFFTVCYCKGAKARDFAQQNVIPIDIDGIDIDQAEKTAKVVCDSLGLAYQKTAVVFTGNGIHLYILLEQAFQEETFFEVHREYYKAICRKISKALRANALPGEPDPSVFATKHLMRMPGTLNRKPNKPERRCEVLQAYLEVQGFDLIEASGLPKLSSHDHIHPKAFKKFPPVDTKGMLQGCEYLKWCKSHQADVSEPQWYAMLSVLGVAENGEELAHEYSKEHPSYTPEETREKLRQALATAGPRTCANIDTLWDGCRQCPHFNSREVKSPVQIQSPDFIQTKHQGFYHVVETQNGKVTRRPDYVGLMKFFQQQHPFVTMTNNEVVYVYNGTHWVEFFSTKIKGFAEEHFNPKPTDSYRTEFLRKVRCNNLRDAEWLDEASHRKINLQNGVYDIDTGELLKHSPDFGFRSILPYAFDPDARAPRFEQFMQEITCERQELVDILLEFAGYAIANDPCWIHKALFLTGEGANGKSTFIEHVLYKLVGADNYAGLGLGDLNNDAKRYLIEGKFFNYSDETPIDALSKSEVFKTMVSGGELVIRKLYHQPYMYQNRCKLIMSCNTLPYSRDYTHGLYRRMLIVPFDARFDEDTRDPYIGKKLDAELPGIFNIIMNAYRNLVARGDFPKSAVVDAQKEEYQLNNDSVRQWIEDRLIEDDGEETVKVLDLLDDYLQYCDQYNLAKCHKVILEKTLATKYREKRCRPREGSKRVMAYKGIRIDSAY